MLCVQQEIGWSGEGLLRHLVVVWFLIAAIAQSMANYLERPGVFEKTPGDKVHRQQDGSHGTEG